MNGTQRARWTAEIVLEVQKLQKKSQGRPCALPIARALAELAQARAEALAEEAGAQARSDHLSVPCPVCGRPAGRPCDAPGFVHTDRQAAALARAEALAEDRSRPVFEERAARGNALNRAAGNKE